MSCHRCYNNCCCCLCWIATILLCFGGCCSAFRKAQNWFYPESLISNVFPRIMTAGLARRNKSAARVDDRTQEAYTSTKKRHPIIRSPKTDAPDKSDADDPEEEDETGDNNPEDGKHEKGGKEGKCGRDTSKLRQPTKKPYQGRIYSYPSPGESEASEDDEEEKKEVEEEEEEKEEEKEEEEEEKEEVEEMEEEGETQKEKRHDEKDNAHREAGEDESRSDSSSANLPAGKMPQIDESPGSKPSRKQRKRLSTDPTLCKKESKLTKAKQLLNSILGPGEFERETEEEHLARLEFMNASRSSRPQGINMLTFLEPLAEHGFGLSMKQPTVFDDTKLQHHQLQHQQHQQKRHSECDMGFLPLFSSAKSPAPFAPTAAASDVNDGFEQRCRDLLCDPLMRSNESSVKTARRNKGLFAD